MDKWVEPSLAEKPSYRDHKGGSYYGVSEHMQPLGEAPNARVKTRVKPDGLRKSVLGKSAAAAGLDARDTPEGTPAPQESVKPDVDPPSNPRVKVEDENDGDYAPTANGKKKSRTHRPRPMKRQSEEGLRHSNAGPSQNGPPRIVNMNKRYNAEKLKDVVEEAKRRAHAAGKPDLAAAVNEIYLQSLVNTHLTQLLEHILSQAATPEQQAEFQNYVKKAKKKLKTDRANVKKRKVPESTNGSQSLPLRSPAKFTSVNTETSAAPSIEKTDNPRKIKK